MASQHIEITGSAGRFASHMRRLIDNTRQLQEDVVKAKDIADQIASGADFAALVTYLGLSGDTAEADAQAVYNMLGDLYSAINSAAVVNTFIDRLG